jgi:N6-adenosine-specific RNA methylase IME4
MSLPVLFHYDAACRALAETVRVDEVKEILDVAVAMRVYARQAKDHDNEANAVELRMRATRRLAELIEAQKQAVGLAKGGQPHQKRNLSTGSVADPVATLAEAGIDKHLAQRARVLGRLSSEKFEEAVVQARANATRSMQRVVTAAAIEQEREAYRARAYQGGTVADLVALAASGFRAGVICPDPPWPFYNWSKQGRQRSPDRHYDTMTIDEIKALPVAPLAAENCALLLWGTWPDEPEAHEVIKAWGFEYSTVAFIWVKTTKHAEAITLDGDGLHWGMGFATRSNTEPVLLATRGSPRRLNADVHQVIIAPVGEHSEKPDEAYRRMVRLYGGSYLELFARKPRDGWTTWGNELPPPAGEMDAPLAPTDDDGGSIDATMARAATEKTSGALNAAKASPPKASAEGREHVCNHCGGRSTPAAPLHDWIWPGWSNAVWLHRHCEGPFAGRDV